MLYGIFILILILDQLTKYFAVKFLMNGESYVIIKGFLQLEYVENFGAAFGILQNRKIFFIIITLAVIIAVIFYLKRNYYYINRHMKVALTMLLAGAVGNFIDRVRLGYVIDFIHVNFGKFYDFPVFNIADSFIVISTILIVYMVLLNKYEK